jgi:hypothetical protein
MKKEKIKFVQDNRITPYKTWTDYLKSNKYQPGIGLVDDENMLAYYGEVNNHPIVDTQSIYENSDRYALHFWLPIKYLNTSTLAIGGMGTGKSNFFKALTGILSFPTGSFPGIPTFIHDVKGEYVEIYYNPETDLILNYLDERGAIWDIYSELMENPLLMKPIIVSMINGYNDKSGEGQAAFWTEMGAPWLIRFFEECQKQEVPVGALPEIIDEKWAIYKSEVGTTGPEHSALITTKPVFEAIRRSYWIARESDRKLITTNDILKAKRTFLVTLREYEKEMKIINSGLLTCLFQKFLSRPDVTPGDISRYFAFILDEYLSFAIDPDVELSIATLARSKGMCLNFGMQYLPEEKKRLASLTNSRFITLIFRVGVKSTAEHFEQMLGDIIYEEMKENISTSTGGPDNKRQKTTSSSWVRHQVKAVPHETFLNMPTGVAFFQVSAQDKRYNSFIKLPEFIAEKHHEPFILDQEAKRSPSIIY